jgi:hypothetical protein
MLRWGRWGKPGWFRVQRCRVVVGGGGVGETWMDRRRMIGCRWARRARAARAPLATAGDWSPELAWSGWWGSAPGAESFFQDWCVWSAFVGYEGARRQATFGEDEVDTSVNAQKGICFWCSHFEEGRNRIE